MSAHTPTPWQFWPSMDAQPHKVVGAASFRNERAEVAVLFEINHYPWSREDPRTIEQTANGEFIVRACNAHDALLQAVLLTECPRPANGKPDGLMAKDCHLSGDCGCCYGAALAAAEWRPE